MSDIAAKTKWQLTQATFDRLLAALSPDREESGDKYILLRNNLVRFFQTRGFSSSDEAADEVLNRLAKKMEGGMEPENPGAYALGIARIVALELHRNPEQTAVQELPEVESPDTLHTTDGNEERLVCLEKCLDALSPDNRRMIVDYYQGNKRKKIENRQKLAEEIGIHQTALRNRAVRIRSKLEDCIRKCLK